MSSAQTPYRVPFRVPDAPNPEDEPFRDVFDEYTPNARTVRMSYGEGVAQVRLARSVAGWSEDVDTAARQTTLRSASVAASAPMSAAMSAVEISLESGADEGTVDTELEYDDMVSWTVQSLYDQVNAGGSAPATPLDASVDVLQTATISPWNVRRLRSWYFPSATQLTETRYLCKSLRTTVFR